MALRHIVLAVALIGAANGAAAQADPPTRALTVCMAEDNAPLSYLVRAGGQQQLRGLDVRVAQAVAAELGRALALLPFESEYEKESTLAHEVNALLSAQVCDLVSGFPLLAGDLGPPSRASSRTPDYPGAKRKRDRPYVTLTPLTASVPYQAAALGVALRLGSAPVETLADLQSRRVGAVAGTIAGAVTLGYRQGLLRPGVVSLGQREDALGVLASGRIDALLLPLTQFDAWRLGHPDSALTLAAARRPLGVNLGWVMRADDEALRAAVNRVIERSRNDGQLARWAAEEGATWQAPREPAVSSGMVFNDLLVD